MNWAALAIMVGGVAAGSVWLAARRGGGSRAGGWLAVPLLIVALLNGAAPFRGLIDPEYMGYVLGLLRAERGLAVTLVSGPVLIGAVLAAHIAVRRSAGPALWIVAVVCAAFAVILGAPWLAGDPSANAIQLGEYATIPGLAATLILLCLLVGPFALGAVWAGRAALRPAR